jgi:hypothetical protein
VSLVLLDLDTPGFEFLSNKDFITFWGGCQLLISFFGNGSVLGMAHIVHNHGKLRFSS